MTPPVGGGLVTTEGEGAFRLFVFSPPPTGGVRGGHNNRLFGLTHHIWDPDDLDDDDELR